MNYSGASANMPPSRHHNKGPEMVVIRHKGTKQEVDLEVGILGYTLISLLYSHL